MFFNSKKSKTPKFGPFFFFFSWTVFRPARKKKILAFSGVLKNAWFFTVRIAKMPKTQRNFTKIAKKTPKISKTLTKIAVFRRRANLPPFEWAPAAVQQMQFPLCFLTFRIFSCQETPVSSRLFAKIDEPGIARLPQDYWFPSLSGKSYVFTITIAFWTKNLLKKSHLLRQS